MESEFRKSLLAIKKPLDFASRRSFANLHKLKDLATLIPALIDNALSAAAKDKSGSLHTIKGDFSSFDSLDTAAKHKLITSALETVEALLSNSLNKSTMEVKIRSVDTELKYIKGVGPRIFSLLSKRGIKRIEDALYHIPYRYDDRQKLKKIAQLKPGEIQQVTGEVLAAGEAPLGRGRRKVFEVVIGDGTGTLTLKWFHYNSRYIKSLYQQGERILVSGEVKLFLGSREMIHPETEKIEKGEEELAGFRRILPVYQLTEGLGQRTMRKIMARVVEEFACSVVDGLPGKLLQKRALLPMAQALKEVHLPPQETDIRLLDEQRTEAYRRLVYDEFFFLELGIAMKHHGVELEEGISIEEGSSLRGKLLSLLPFTLTPAQSRVIGEIDGDLAAASPMHRLIQGDVGCGKTLVALMAALSAVEGGCQAAIMAPTEILAEQHYLNIHHLAEDVGIKVALIKGSQKGKEKREAIERIAEGEADIVIGTHALIQEGVVFRRLGLGIIDEQHRFGVVQRARLKKMGAAGAMPNILVMTATPIPRSLAMTVYGDLELSVIDELPPGREKVETKLYHERDREKVYMLIERELKKGRQAYVVYPLVEESEKMELMDATRMAGELADVFPGFSVGLIHGKMKVEDKEAVMAAFKAGEMHLLVCTTVIEVGIDVPNATIMVVEHAERFGLSQLHQLRGRVGRGPDKSLCLLLAQYRKSGEARERLRVMERCSSGFDISEEDLKIRGPGDFLGTRQSGMPDFRIGNILKDERILKEAREDAFALIETDPDLSHPDNKMVKEILTDRWKGRLELAGVG